MFTLIRKQMKLILLIYSLTLLSIQMKKIAYQRMRFFCPLNLKFMSIVLWKILFTQSKMKKFTKNCSLRLKVGELFGTLNTKFIVSVFKMTGMVSRKKNLFVLQKIGVISTTFNMKNNMYNNICMEGFLNEYKI